MSNSTAITTKPYDYVGGIIAYESGELDEDGIVELFQYLIDSKIVYGLQGCYQRMAQQLIDGGYIAAKGA